MIDDRTKVLREHNVRGKAHRLAVLGAVSRRPHCMAEDIAEGVRREIGTIACRAEYVALGILAERSNILRLRPAGSPTHFEVRVGDNRHHLIYRTCGKTVDVDRAIGGTPCSSAADASSFQIDEAEVIY